ncbi:protein kinase [Pseudomonas sp. Z5-35]|uniref:protein kinase domain-containing protein n=1 Tax=Pseudomonas sp. Z5-35 TaxID=2817415 RepID=UPI003DAA08C2
MSRIEQGAVFGQWTLGQLLGKGGNGEVWEATNEGGERRAIKVLIRGGTDEPYQRFCREIEVLKGLGIPEGIVPLLDSYIPANPKRERPWYVMPLAVPYLDTIEHKNPFEIATDFQTLAKTLSRLHGGGISHRDIKPANFLVLDGQICLSDFGLVKLPNAEGLTPERRDVGAKFTMAPEMRRAPIEADGQLADIYSLAKSLWMVLTRRPLGFDGQYDPRTSVGLRHYFPELYLTPLDELLATSTDHEPRQRHPLEHFIEMLEQWKGINDDFDTRNGHEWREVADKIFPLGTPARAQWEDRLQICAVLNTAASSSGLNHMFYPTGGGMTLIAADLAPENDMIELQVSDRMFEICCPERLYFESCAGKPEWNYFRLELKPIYPALDNDAFVYLEHSEELTEIAPGVYAPLNAWFENEYRGRPLSEEARRVTRLSRGSFVIFSTSSVYNRVPGTYDARHNTMSADEFRAYIQRSASRS